MLALAPGRNNFLANATTQCLCDRFRCSSLCSLDLIKIPNLPFLTRSQLVIKFEARASKPHHSPPRLLSLASDGWLVVVQDDIKGTEVNIFILCITVKQRNFNSNERSSYPSVP